MSKTFKPLKITATLLTPLCIGSSNSPMLDGILTSLVGHRKAGRVYVSRHSRIADTRVVAPVNLKFTEIAGRFVHHVSSPILNGPEGRKPIEWPHYFVRMWDGGNAHYLDDDLLRKIPQGGGEFKSYRLPMRILQVERVVWFACGRRRELMHDLRDITAIGNRVSCGFGIVGQWESEFVDHDYSWFVPRDDGTLAVMRPLPRCNELPKNLSGFRVGYGACQPPYFHRDRFGEIVEPVD